MTKLEIHGYETYPVIDFKNSRPLYFVEFHRGFEGKPLTWALFRRQFLYPESERLPQTDRTLYLDAMGNEVHPWNLGGGKVNEDEHAVDMNTMSFLKFMVDALNEKVDK